MTDIASNLDKVIEKLDGMTSEVVAKNYGMDIASKVDHIAKQLDYVQSGGSSGGGNIMWVNFFWSSMNPSVPPTADKTYTEIDTWINNGGICIGKDTDSLRFYVISSFMPTDDYNGGYYLFTSSAFISNSVGAQLNQVQFVQYDVFQDGSIKRDAYALS